MNPPVRLQAMPSFDELDAMPLDERELFLTEQLHRELDRGNMKSDFVNEYRKWQRRCSYIDETTGVRCTRQRMDPQSGTRCTNHFDLKDYSPEEWAKAQAITAKVRLAEAAERAVTELVDMVEDDEIPPAVRLKAAESILDRAGVARVQHIELQADVTTEDKSSAVEVIKDRLRALAVPVHSEVTEQPAIEATG